MVTRGIGGHVDVYDAYIDSDFENWEEKKEEEEGEGEDAIAIADYSSRWSGIELTILVF